MKYRTLLFLINGSLYALLTLAMFIVEIDDYRYNTLQCMLVLHGENQDMMNSTNRVRFEDCMDMQSIFDSSSKILTVEWDKKAVVVQVQR